MNAYDLPESPKTLLVSSSIQPIYLRSISLNQKTSIMNENRKRGTSNNKILTAIAIASLL